MKRHTTRLNQQEQEVAAAQQNNAQTQSNAALQFNTAEEVLRRDCSQMRLPSGVARRLQESVNAEPKPKQRWWKRWLGDSNG